MLAVDGWGVRLVQLLYLMAPAYAANMAPPFVRYWPWWNRPISERWLGSHKTLMGFGLGVAAAVVTAFAQSRIAWPGTIADYRDWLDLGVRMGVGAMLADSAKSLVKRRVGVAPGRPWVPWDQVDFVLGALVLVWPRIALSAIDVLVILLVSVVGHIAVNHAGYWIGVRDVKW